MISQQNKELLAKLGLAYTPIALKYHYTLPAGVERIDERHSFCECIHKAQTEHRRFYIQKEDEDCLGKAITGMAPKASLDAAGIMGADLGVFRTTLPNARLHASYPMMKEGTVNYVEFCPLDLCDFHPDLLLIVAETAQAEILMRATSYISGDLWESRCSSVASCAWMYVYPLFSGKVNFCITGMHHGVKRRRLYPAGMHMISIPYQKLDEVFTALGEMPWELVSMREDEEGKAQMAALRQHWKELCPEGGMEK